MLERVTPSGTLGFLTLQAFFMHQKATVSNTPKKREKARKHNVASLIQKKKASSYLTEDHRWDPNPGVEVLRGT